MLIVVLASYLKKLMPFVRRKMKNKVNLRPYTKQFYKGNAVSFIFAFVQVLISSFGALAISWLIQQLVDLIGGQNTTYNLLQLTTISVVLIIGFTIIDLLLHKFKPKFVTKGISQYKEYVFEELTRKNISAFSDEAFLVCFKFNRFKRLFAFISLQVERKRIFFFCFGFCC